MRALRRSATCSLALALCAGLAVAWPQAALAAPGDRAEDTSLVAEECSAGGILYGPKYLTHGGFEIGIGLIPLFNFAPRDPGVPFIAEVGSIFKPVEGGPDAFVQIGPEPKFGLRSPLFESDYGALGWSAGYREDMAFRGPAFGLGQPYFGLLPIPGVTSSKGGQVTVDAHVRLGQLELAATPRTAWMSNGVRLGGTAGLTLDLGTVKVGYDLDMTRNVAVAPEGVTGLPDAYSFMVMHGVGIRQLMSRDVALQGNAYFIPSDFFGNRNLLGSVGVIYRFRGLPSGPEPGGYPTAVAAR